MSRDDFVPVTSSAWRLLYVSLVTITTVGYGDSMPNPESLTAQLLVMLELGLGFYFLVILVARIVVWQRVESRNWERQSMLCDKWRLRSLLRQPCLAMRTCER
jgi:ion channel